MPTKKIKGIIYRIYDKEPADKVLNIIDDHGKKVVAMAKGVRKEMSKKSHAINLGNLISASLVDGYNVGIITDIRAENEFTHWKDGLSRMFMLQLICEIVSKFTFEENEDKELFSILKQTLESKTDRPLFLISVFILKTLELTGNLPDLQKCIVTSDSMKSDSVYQQPQAIGYVSDSAFKDNSFYSKDNLMKVPDRIYKTQIYAIHNKISDSLRINLSEEEDKTLFKQHLEWLEEVLGQDLKTKPFVMRKLR